MNAFPFRHISAPSRHTSAGWHRAFRYGFLTSTALISLSMAQTLTESDIPIRPTFVRSPRADTLYQVLVAELAGKRSQIPTAAEHYRNAALASGDPALLERATMLALMSKQHAGALELARKWYGRLPAHEAARQALALALLRNGQVDEAVLHLEVIRASVGNRDKQEGFTTVASLLGQVEDKQVALRALAQFSAQQPQSAFAQYYHGVMAAAAGDQVQALASLQRALVQNPRMVQAHLLRARILIEKGDRHGALLDLATAVKDVPRDQSLRMNYIRLLMDNGDIGTARREFAILVKKSPKDNESVYTLATQAVEVRMIDIAEALFQILLRRKTRLADVYFEMGRIAEQRGDFEKAHQWYDKVSGHERAISAQLRKGAVLAKAGETTSLREHFETLRRQQPENSAALFLAESESLREAHRPEESFEALERGLSAHPNDKELLYARALSAEQVERLDVMERDLKALIDQNPQHAQALNALGYTLANRTDRFQEALGYIERALALSPDDPAILDSMGWVQYRMGNPAAALEHVRKAYRLNQDPEIVSHFIELLWVNGQKDEAQRIYQLATQKNPGHPMLRALKERFGW